MYWASSEEAEGMFTPFQSQLTQLQQVKELSQNVVELAKSYTQAGDPASAQAALQIVANLGQHYSNPSGEDGLNRGVGGAAEIMALCAMDLSSSYDGGGQTVQDRINQLREQRKAIRGLYATSRAFAGNAVGPGLDRLFRPRAGLRRTGGAPVGGRQVRAEMTRGENGIYWRAWKPPNTCKIHHLRKPTAESRGSRARKMC